MLLFFFSFVNNIIMICFLRFFSFAGNNICGPPSIGLIRCNKGTWWPAYFKTSKVRAKGDTLVVCPLPPKWQTVQYKKQSNSGLTVHVAKYYSSSPASPGHVARAPADSELMLVPTYGGRLFWRNARLPCVALHAGIEVNKRKTKLKSNTWGLQYDRTKQKAGVPFPLTRAVSSDGSLGAWNLWNRLRFSGFERQPAGLSLLQRRRQDFGRVLPPFWSSFQQGRGLTRAVGHEMATRGVQAHLQAGGSPGWRGWRKFWRGRRWNF